jgi:hypothetical protein
MCCVFWIEGVKKLKFENRLVVGGWGFILFYMKKRTPNIWSGGVVEYIMKKFSTPPPTNNNQPTANHFLQKT